jgi:hypothetical protein
LVLAEKTDVEVVAEAVLAEPREAAAPQSPPMLPESTAELVHSFDEAIEAVTYPDSNKIYFVIIIVLIIGKGVEVKEMKSIWEKTVVIVLERANILFCMRRLMPRLRQRQY